MKHLGLADLEAGLEEIRQSPRDAGVLKSIVRRPQTGQREVLQSAELDRALGLVGDNWKTRGSISSPDGLAHPNKQITIMNARAIALVACEPDRWKLAGDQLYVDMDLSVNNLPPGTRLAIEGAVVEISTEPHTGCRQFAARFGREAMTFVNSIEGKALRLRGLNAKVVEPGIIRVGDIVRKLGAASYPA